MVKAQRVRADDAALLDPGARAWDAVASAEMTLEPTPVTSQPSVYVQAKWEQKPYGETGRLSVRAAHNGERLYFHLSWPDESKDDGIRDTDQFADAAAILFPVKGDAPLQSMGSPEQPVNAWYWRADAESAISVTATGVGSSVRHPNGSLRAAASYESDGWRVVIGRPLVVDQEGMVQLRSGWEKKVGFAVWQGANQERGGLKAVTLDWEPLEIEA
jgi:DMSO reductase family type II enzyme heme b subunit